MKRSIPHSLVLLPNSDVLCIVFSKLILLDGTCDVDRPFLVYVPWPYFHILNWAEVHTHGNVC